ncbi:MAG: folate family ECF transporter S component [Oscillospiraceae bacterium]|jgi:ECF transporter S component (folate family)|nr:folate family ECF transporter S component [Oscillospiraceae bacterium]
MNAKIATRTTVSLAVLAALSIVLSRVLAINSGPMRFSIGSTPIVLAGLLFGPIGGVLVGFGADFLGAVFLGNGPYNPLLCVTPILMGLIPGLLRRYVWNKPSLVRIYAVMLPSYVVGAMLYTTFILAKFIYSDTTFLPLLGWRVLTYVITLAVDGFIIFLLIKTNMFYSLGIVKKNQ